MGRPKLLIDCAGDASQPFEQNDSVHSVPTPPGPPSETDAVERPAASAAFRAFVGGPRFCLRCGYERRGIAADAPCPECGAGPPPRQIIQVNGQTPHLRNAVRRLWFWIDQVCLGLIFVTFLIGILRAGGGGWRSGLTLLVPIVALGLMGLRVFVLVGKRGSDGARWHFTVGGVRIDANGQTQEVPWSRIRTMRRDANSIRFDIGGVITTDRWLYTGQSDEVTQELLSELVALRDLAGRLPESVATGIHFADIVLCERCGAQRSAAEGSRPCPACGAVVTGNASLVTGRSHPQAAARTLLWWLSVGLMLVVVLAGVITVNAITPALQQTMVPSLLVGLVTLPGIVKALRTARGVLRDGAAYVDRRWNVETRGLTVVEGREQTTYPWSDASQPRLGEERGAWRKLEVSLRGAEGPQVRYLWVSAPQADAALAQLVASMGRTHRYTGPHGDLP